MVRQSATAWAMYIEALRKFLVWGIRNELLEIAVTDKKKCLKEGMCIHTATVIGVEGCLLLCSRKTYYSYCANVLHMYVLFVNLRVQIFMWKFANNFRDNIVDSKMFSNKENYGQNFMYVSLRIDENVNISIIYMIKKRVWV